MSEDSPRQIGRYEIITLLGEGGMARAYLAVSHGPGGFNKLAVIKQILPQYASDSEFVAMFLDEARLAARLHHPNIVQTYDVAEHDGNFILAMEYLEGLSLASIYRRIHPRVLPIETHLWVLTQVLTGLHYAHALCDYDGTPLGVVHRDVNPANVLVTYGGDVKLLDFGVAKARGALAANTERNIKGKPAYCAPEQLWGGEPDARADVFAAGVMLWEVMAGRRFNRSKSLIEAAKTRLSGKEPLIREVCPEVDPALAEICDRAMAWDPEQRYANAAEFRIELQAQLDKRSVPGRRILVERMEEVFATERRELGKLIETRLADRTAFPSSTSTSGTHVSVVSPLPSSTPSKTPSTSVATSNTPTKPFAVPVHTSFDARPTSTTAFRLLVGAAILAAAVASGFIVWSFRWNSGPASQEQALSTTPSRPAAASAAAVTAEKLGPAPAGPAEAAHRTGPANPPETSPGTRSRAQAGKPRPVKSPLKPGPQVPIANAVTRPAPPSRAAAQPPSEAPPPAVEASPAPSARRRPPASDQSGSTVQPGGHLLRPAVPVHTNVDEKDPYTP